MSGALLRRGLRRHATLLAAVGAGLFLFELLLVWVAARLDTGPGLRSFLETLLPPDVREIIFGQLGLASFGGAVSFGFQHPFALIGAIAVVIVLATVPAAERETGFGDLVLARPVSRARYLGAHVFLLAAAAVYLPACVLAGAATGLAVVDAPVQVAWTRYLPCAQGLALFLLAVGGYSLLFSSDTRRRGTAAARAAGLTLLFYWLDFMGAYWDVLETARRVSPFFYYEPAAAAAAGGVTGGDALVLIAIWAVTTGAAFAVFRRSDP